MEKKKTDDSPVPVIAPVDRFGFLKQEQGNSPPRFIKTRSSTNYEKYVSIGILLKNQYILP